MRKLFYILFIGISLTFVGCKSDFEKVRISGEPDKIYAKAFEYYYAEDYSKAQVLFEQIITSFRGTDKAEKLYLAYCYTHYYLGNYILGSYYFNTFTKTYSTSPKKEEADFQKAMCYYNMSPNYKLDQTNTTKAIDAFQNYANSYPQNQKVAQCNAYIDELRVKLEKKAFANCKLYYDLTEYLSAITAFDNMLKDFPDTKNGEEIRYLMVKSSYLLAHNSIYEKKEERYKEVLKYYAQFIKKFPNSDKVSEVKKLNESSLAQIKIFEHE